MFRRTLLCFSLIPWPLVLSLGTTEKRLAPASYTLPSGFHVHCWDSPEFSLLHAGYSQLSQSLSLWEMLQPLSHLPGPFPDCVQRVFVCFILGSPHSRQFQSWVLFSVGIHVTWTEATVVFFCWEYIHMGSTFILARRHLHFWFWSPSSLHMNFQEFPRCDFRKDPTITFFHYWHILIAQQTH